MKKKYKLPVLLSAVFVIGIAGFILYTIVTSENRFSFNANNKKLVFYNWKNYTDISILNDFEKETGITVVLKEFDTANQAIAEIQSNPDSYDLIGVDDGMTPLLKKLKLIRKLDFNKIPNSKYIKKQFRMSFFYAYSKNLAQYAIPYHWGTTGLVINTRFVKEPVNSWGILWNKKYSGKAIVLDDLREAMSVLLNYSGFSLNTKDIAELETAGNRGLGLKKNRILFDDYISAMDKILKEEKWIAQMYNATYLEKASKQKHLKYILPEEGYNLWVTHFSISSDSRRLEAAYRLLNFLLKPEISARSATKLYSATVVQGSEAHMPPELINNPVLLPSPEELKRGEYYQDLGAIINEHQRIFNSIKKD
ncbi:MAG: spermidine/putrescine ABC transporter substrate-binding protein [bacterium]|nr:spermidine/putrescine ABC transporter substrate-binding protein [bacterium]